MANNPGMKYVSEVSKDTTYNKILPNKINISSTDCSLFYSAPAAILSLGEKPKSYLSKQILSPVDSGNVKVFTYTQHTYKFKDAAKVFKKYKEIFNKCIVTFSNEEKTYPIKTVSNYKSFDNEDYLQWLVRPNQTTNLFYALKLYKDSILISNLNPTDSANLGLIQFRWNKLLMENRVSS